MSILDKLDMSAPLIPLTEHERIVLRERRDAQRKMIERIFARRPPCCPRCGQ